MDIVGFEQTWNRNWANQPPIGSDLKIQFNDYSLRLDSLPNGKRYPDSENELGEVIRRYYAELNALRAAKDTALVVIVTEWSNSQAIPIVKPESFGLTGEVAYWRTIDVSKEEENPEFKSYAHKFIASVSGIEQLKSLLEKVARDEIGDVIIGSEDLRWILHPYDGGADILVRSSDEKANLSQKFVDWIDDDTSNS